MVTVRGEQATSGPLFVTLGWSTQPVDPRSVRAGLQRSTDIHLGCLWQTTDRQAGVVQSLGGSDHAPGFGGTILRIGPRSETAGESVTVALKEAYRLRRLLFYAYAYSGEPEWEALGVVLTAELKAGAVLEMRLEGAGSNGGVAALASVHRVGADLVVRREAEYVQGQQQQVAEAYGWELAWAAGRTVPPPRTVR